MLCWILPSSWFYVRYNIEWETWNHTGGIVVKSGHNYMRICRRCGKIERGWEPLT